ncbi:MAG TPA: OsmC family protein [Vicinamibacterales bacterium]|nr:OsmC family protein [Vicinamibacterales bacterium]
MADEMVSTVSVKLKEAYEFLATFDKFPGAAPILLDEPPPLGEGHGPNAAALVGAAVGNCLAASLLFCLRRSRVEVDALESKVTVRVARLDGGRLRIAGIDVVIDPGLAPGHDPARFDRCKGLFEEFCTVTQSIRKGIPVEVSVGAASAGADAG